jgi:hypothetical protein
LIDGKEKMSSNGTQDKPFGEYIPNISFGDRVIVTGGAWSGYSGEYAGSEKTLVGVLHKVNLDNGASTLVPLSKIALCQKRHQ